MGTLLFIVFLGIALLGISLYKNSKTCEAEMGSIF